LSIFVIAGIVALASVSASTMMFNETNSQTLSQTETLIDEPKEDVSKPSEYKHWIGVPILEAFPASLDRENFHEIKSNEYSWLQNVLENGVAIVDTEDLKEFEKLSNGNYYFKIDGMMYSIHYSTAKVNLENDYVRVIPLDNQSSNAREVSNTLIVKGLDDPYNWVQISDIEANQYFNLKVDGSEFKTSLGDIRLQYIGKLSPESHSLDYKAIVDRSAGKIMGDHDE
jgi:hypothetical protein